MTLEPISVFGKLTTLIGSPFLLSIRKSGYYEVSHSMCQLLEGNLNVY